jgi:hypothetical protein
MLTFLALRLLPRVRDNDISAMKYDTRAKLLKRQKNLKPLNTTGISVGIQTIGTLASVHSIQCGVGYRTLVRPQHGQCQVLRK